MKNVFDFDYDKSIVSLSNSILRYYHVKQTHPSLECLDKEFEINPKNVVLMILDGLGAALLKKNLPADSFLRQNLKDEIFSVFPPTTAAATIAYHSALTPYESGWLGWMCYYPEIGEIVENFNNVAFYTREKLNTPAPSKTLIKFKTIYEQITEQNPDVAYFKIFPDFEPDGCASFDEMCMRIVEASKTSDKRKIISAYWTEPDHLTHLCGTNAQEVKDVLRQMDLSLQKMAENLENTLLIISADHGLIDVEELYINDYPVLCDMLEMPPCLESRFVTFYVKNACYDAFQAEFEKVFGSYFKLYTKEAFLKTGMLGNGIRHRCVDGCLGDFVAIAIKDKTLRYRPENFDLKGNKADHAGISEDEMKIPLIVKAF